MSALPPQWWRDESLLAAEVARHGSPTDASRALGVSERTIQRWSKKFGITATLPAPTTVVSVSREEMLEQELSELKAAMSLKRKSEVKDERIIELLREMIPAVEPVFKPAPSAKEAGGTPHAFVLLWSDLHASERVFSDQMNGINEYDWSIMLERHHKIINAITSFKENRPYPVPTLHIVGLGDMVTGDIHDELRVTNEMTIMETALQLGMDGASFIESLIPLFENIIIDGVVGNHGRLQKKPPAKNQHDNFDWMVYHLIKLRLAKYPSVEVRVPKSWITKIQVQDRWNLVASHGDGIRSTMVGVPWGGILRRAKELERQFSPTMGTIDHFLFGHWHEANVVANRRVIVNGSVKGVDEWVLKNFGAGADATQLLLTFHPRRGLTDVSYLDLQR